MVFTKKELNVTLCQLADSDEDTLWIEINHVRYKFLLGVVYRPPSNNLEKDEILYNKINRVSR